VSTESKKEQTSDQLYSRILRKIATRELAPGQHLVEEELAQLFKTSRTPIREALFKLEQDGLVQKTRNQGARVAAFTPDDIEEIYEIRKALECLATRNAVNNLKLNDLFEFERELEELRKKTGADWYQRLYDIDLRLHESIVSHSGNQRLISYLDKLALLINSVRLLSDSFEHHARIGIDEHLGIVRALMQRNTELAERLIGEHIDAARGRAIEFFQHIGKEKKRVLTKTDSKTLKVKSNTKAPSRI
jgi:DNA-binding GntR family transcriptional regulator